MTDPTKPEENIRQEHTQETPPAEANEANEQTTDSAAENSTTEQASTAPEAQPEETPQKTEPEELNEERLERLRRKQERQGAVPSLRHDPTFMPNKSLSDIDQELERELEEAMGGLSEAEMYAEKPQPNQQAEAGPKGRKKGKIISIHGPDVFVDIPGSRSQGVLPMTQFDQKPEIGSEVEVDIEGYDAENGLLIVTRKGAAVEANWASVQTGMIVEARVVETNKGGLTVDVNGIRGFMPISQIELFRVEKAEDYVNQRLRCEVIEVKPQERNLVVSRRALLEREREAEREKLWQELAEGQIREGVVRKVQNFGAFVDLGGVDGLLHVSEMSWLRVNDPSEVVQPGQRIKVVILKVDHGKRRIGLGLKQLVASPWDNIEEKYPPGMVVTGKVTRIAQFGAFVELEPGVEGLIHISELANQRVHRVVDVVEVGQEVSVQVLSTDLERKRISLSLKATQVPEAAETEVEEEQEEAAPPQPQRPRTTPLRGGIGDKEWKFE